MNDNNEAKLMKKIIKKDFNKLGLTLLMQGLVANIVVILGIIGSIIMQMLKDPNVSATQLIQIAEKVCFSGTLSIIAVMIAFIPILIYRRKKFFQYDLKAENKKFNLKTVIISLIILLGVNSVLVLLANGLELGLNTIGLSANSALKDLEILNQSTVSMIMYTCIIAPVFEEFIYRGAVLRSLEKYGRKFAILVSAILFGMMHGNFYQIFMAIGVGIILGYLATEYSIKLTIILHIINNTFVVVTSQVTSHVSENAGNIMNISITAILVLILVIAFIRNKNNMKELLQNNRMEKGIMLKFITSITIILIISFDLFMVVSGINKL